MHRHSRRDDEHHAHTHIERAIHLFARHLSYTAKQFEDEGNFPGAGLNDCLQTWRQDTRYVALKAPTSDMCHTFDGDARIFTQGLYLMQITAVRAEQYVNQWLTQFWKDGIEGKGSENTPGKRVAVCMQAARR